MPSGAGWQLSGGWRTPQKGGISLTTTGYATTSHNHDSAYAAKSHNHDTAYAAKSHNHDNTYATISTAQTLSNKTLMNPTLRDDSGSGFAVHVPNVSRTTTMATQLDLENCVKTSGNQTIAGVKTF